MKSVLRRLVRLFPSAFREQFGDDITEQIDRDYERAWARGFGAAMWFSITAATDLVRSAIAERVDPTWSSARQPASKETGMKWLRSEWARDLRYAVRALRRSPGFAAVTIGTLALAIGVNAAMFGVVNTVLIHPLPYAHVDRIVHIGAAAPGSGFPDEFGVSPEFYVAYKESKLLEDVSTYNSFTATMRAGERVERIRMSWPTYTLFSTLGAKAAVGRLPNAEDDETVAVISDQLWTSWFSRDSSVVGRSYEIAGGKRTIVGVMPPSFKFPNDGALLWIGSAITPAGIAVPGRFGNALVARMAPGVTTEQLARELTTMSKRFPERFGGSADYAKIMKQHHAVVRTITDQLLGSVAGPLWVLLAAVGIVMLIACANVANLFLVRGEGRQRDLAVRRAIGATRSQLVRSQMAEAMTVAACAGVAATLLAWLGLPAFLRAAPTGIPRLEEVGFHFGTIVFTFAAALVASLACGLIPAIRGSAPDLARLRDGGRGSTRRQTWARGGLVVGQTALALVLLIGSGLLVRSFWALRHVKPGYSTENLFTFQIAPGGPHLTDGPTFAQFDLDFMKRLSALPGVESVGLVENIPLDEATATTRFRTEDMSDADGGTMLNYTFTAGDYFKTMHIDVLRGRPLETNDHVSNLRNIVISRSAANHLWPGKDPIGRRVQRQGLTTWETVVGVVEDVMQNNFREPGQPVVYFPLVGPDPHSWIISSPAFVIRTQRAETIGPEVRALVRQVAPDAPMYRVYTMAGLARRSMVQLSFTMLTLGIVSVLALILGAVGLYGVLSYVVAQRTREIGVRMALGAEAGRVRRMVVAQGARVVVIGVVIGVGVALASTRALGTLLFGVEALDVTTFVGMSASMLAIGLLASYVPARRASKVAPIESLRGD